MDGKVGADVWIAGEGGQEGMPEMLNYERLDISIDLKGNNRCGPRKDQMPKDKVRHSGCGVIFHRRHH